MRRLASYLSVLLLALTLVASPAAYVYAAEEPAASPEAAKEEAGLPQADTSRFPSQIFWLVITFGLTYVLMRYAALPNVEEIVSVRERRIIADIEEAKQLNEQGKKQLAEYEGRLAAAHRQAQEVYQLSSEENQKKAMLRTNAQNQTIENRLAEAEQRLAILKQQTLSSIDTEIEAVVGQMVSKLTGTAPNAAEVKAAISKVKGA